MPKRFIGLYLGVNSVGAVVVENKKVIVSSKSDFSIVEEDLKKQHISGDIKLQAIINKVLNELFTEEKNIYVCLADKDFIFRSLDFPIMKKSEIESSLIYQIAEYIPFKLEELNWAYDYNIFSKEDKMTIFFLGIKSVNLEKIKEIFSNLGKEVVVFEPSAIALARVIKSLKKFSNIKNFAMLDFVGSESYLTLFYYDLPLFNRYLPIPKKDNKIDFDKFIDSVRLSLQYFKREFSFYKFESFILISEETNENLISFLKDETQQEIEVLTPFEITKSSVAGIENIKAFGAAIRDSSSYKLKPILTKPLIEKEDYLKKERLQTPPINIILVIILTLVGIVISVLLFSFYDSNISVEKFKVKKESKELQNIIPEELRVLSLEEKKALLQKEEEKLTALKKIEKKVKIKDFFEKIGTLPAGFTLERIDFNLETDKYRATIAGYCFLDNSEKEREAIDIFVSEFKKHTSIGKIFKNIDIVSVETRQRDKFQVTYFLIKFE